LDPRLRVQLDGPKGSDVFLAGPLDSIRAVGRCLLECGFVAEGTVLREVVDAPDTRRSLRLPRCTMTFEQPAIVGIINMTPDSFYEGARITDVERGIEVGAEMEASGAAVLEIGGEKAGPGDPVLAEDELNRVLPVVEGIRARSAIPISIDTRKPDVARRAVEAGADIVNDIDGFRNPQMRDVIATTRAAAILMHIQGASRVATPKPAYSSVLGDITRFLHEQLDTLKAAGVESGRVAIDPGPGFGKALEHDRAVMAGWAEFRGFPNPVMLAISRKRFIGETLGLEASDRLGATLAMTAFILAEGCSMIRTHDVAATAQVVQLISAIRADSDV